MKNIKFSANWVIFILFFGMALTASLQNKNWLEALLFIILGIIFFLADNKK